MSTEYTPEKVNELIEQANGLRPTWNRGMYGSRDDMYANVKPLVSRLADALTAVSAERDAAIVERDDLEDRLAAYLCDSTGGRLSKTGYDVRTMVQHTEEYYDRVHGEELDRIEADRDRLHKAITEALAFESVLPAIATEPRHILRAALDKEGDDDE